MKRDQRERDTQTFKQGKNLENTDLAISHRLVFLIQHAHHSSHSLCTSGLVAMVTQLIKVQMVSDTDGQ